jgi:hypothetical protein
MQEIGQTCLFSKLAKVTRFNKLENLIFVSKTKRINCIIVNGKKPFINDVTSSGIQSRQRF